MSVILCPVLIENEEGKTAATYLAVEAQSSGSIMWASGAQVGQLQKLCNLFGGLVRFLLLRLWSLHETNCRLLGI